MTAYVLLFDHLSTWLAVLIPMLCFVFLLFAMKAYYQQGWAKTLLKFLILLICYCILLIVFFTITALVSWLTYR